MFNKRLIGMVSESKKYIAGNVILQWLGLCSNIMLILSIGTFFEKLLQKTVDNKWIINFAIIFICSLIIHYLSTLFSSRMSYLSSKSVKKTLRHKIYEKLLCLGPSYHEQVSTSEVVQVSVEGIEQLESYFGSYLPQFFYALIAPITLFIVTSFINFPAAIVLLVCVPLIPVTIIVVQKLAKKLFAKYWNQYTGLGDSFLENLQGLTTLKIYRAEEKRHKEMNEDAESFRKITMKVLSAQLNSITIMDLVSFGGAALGIVIAVTQFAAGNVNLAGCIAIILLSADFFIPMRQLGSFFHIAMNGVAASEKIFKLIDLPNPPNRLLEINKDNHNIVLNDIQFSYNDDRVILKDLNLSISQGSFVSIVGESGSGKSTIAGLLCGQNKNYSGTIKIGETELSEIAENNLMKNITYISHSSYLFKGTVRENLLMAKSSASDEELWQILERTKLAGFLKSEKGLDTLLSENAANLSGGQRQRLALSRALLHDSPIYVIDEATSNIDVESETDIIKEIISLAGKKTVILISHRLANVVHSDSIYVMQDGKAVESGKHEELLNKKGTYAILWNQQSKLEQYLEEGEKK